MVERRGRDLDLATRRGGGVLGHDSAEDLELDLTQHQLVLFAEAAALGEQALHADIAVRPERVDPRQLVPHLQVAKVGL